jgi:3-oxoacyl-[acyl-carrier-protein] synthase II
MAGARIAITGRGVITPLGNDVPTFWNNLCAGKSGVSFLKGMDLSQLRTDVAAQIDEFDTEHLMPKKERQLHGRVTLMMLAAAHQALEEAQLPHSSHERTGVLLGTGQGPVEILENNFDKVRERGIRSVSPFFIPGAMPNAATAVLSIQKGFCGPSFTVASACATGTHALGLSAMLIASGEADVMVVGSGEAAIFPSCVAGFGNARALARSVDGDPTRASRPFDKGRNGFVIGEGAGCLVLESESHAKQRGATILAYLDGWGMTSDAEHIARPHPEGKGLRRCIEAALRRAQVVPEQLGYINPHATSTTQGDIAEYVALQGALGQALKIIPISATKSMIGHLLGGAGSVEAVATVCTLLEQRVHPSINLDQPDPVFELNMQRECRSLAIGSALKTSAGFGGHNAALLFAKALKAITELVWLPEQLFQWYPSWVTHPRIRLLYEGLP